MLGFYEHFSYGCFCWLSMAYITAGITLSVVPSSNVEVGQIVTIQCELDKTPNSTLVMFFEVQSPSNVSTVCILVMTNSECRTYDDCVPFYNTFCRNSTLFSTQLNISKNWIGASVFCRTFNETSNSVVLLAEVPVSSITLLPTVISVIAGQQMNLTCETSYCYPPANITWYKSLNDITNQSTSKTYIVDGLTKTVSVLLSPVVKADNRNQIYCIANNTRNTQVSSSIRTLDVTYKPEIKPILSSLYSVIEGETATMVCEVTDANPNTSITWRWFKTDRPNIVLYNGPNYTIPNIQRVGSGSYSCTANNTVGTSEPATIQVDVQYKPKARSSTPSPYRIMEGQFLSLMCMLIDANPNTGIVWRWFYTATPDELLYNKPNYTIQNIDRGKSGSYSCTASNTVGTSKAATIDVDVLYTPSIEEKKAKVVNESNKVSLTREIYSNPLSNVSWFDGSNLLKSEVAVNISILVIEEAKCTDTKNLTLTASNALQRNVSSLVELIVNCKPTSDINNITVGVSEDTGFVFSTIVIAYPKPYYVLLSEDGKRKNDILYNMTENAVNNFTIHFTKTTVEQDDYGTFVVYINNTFGKTSIYVKVIPQRKPDRPRDVETICNVKSAKIQWISSFNGGDPQTFTVHAFLEQQETSRSKLVHDGGENTLHNTQIQNLLPSTAYIFYVVANNKHGNSSSEVNICKTLEETYTNYAPIIGGSLAGTILVVILILVTVFLICRRNTCTCEIKYGKRKRGKAGETNQKSSHYTGMTEYENTQRNVYDELTNNQSEYEDVSMEERDVNNANMYEDVGSTAKQVPSEDQSNVLCAKGSSKPLPERPLEGATGVYINTTFMN